MRLRPIAAFAPLVLLAACGGNPQAQGLVVSGGPDGALPPVRAEDGPELAALTPAPVDEPAELKGLSPIQVKAVLGKPMFTRRDAPAEIWQYRGRACTLDLFLYDDSAGQKVAHYAVRSVNAVGEKECLDELMAGSRGVPTS
ncbi:MAG: hypothetical protein AB1918_00125 [Pseudomonadota bacterium]